MLSDQASDLSCRHVKNMQAGKSVESDSPHILNLVQGSCYSSMHEKDANFYIDGDRSGNRCILANTITLIESAHPAHRQLGRRVVDSLLPKTVNAVRWASPV